MTSVTSEALRPGRSFDAADEENVRELAALIGETLDALRGPSS